jgi:hypothetical protein
MTSTQRNANGIFASDENLREWFRRKAHTQAYQDAQQRAEAGPHPTLEMLCDYVAGDMNATDARIISDHALFCGLCAQEILRIRMVRDAVGQNLDEIEQEIWGAEEEMPFYRQRKVPMIPLADNIALEMRWEPLRQTASGIQEEHTFQTADGRITATCQWECPKDHDPGYIEISWQADIESERELSLQFIQPDTHEILYAEHLGVIRNSHATFTFEELGFDPTQEKWAIAIV